MGWANCGVDSEGRPIGHAFEAECVGPVCVACATAHEAERGVN